jgi:hypothetical protein
VVLLGVGFAACLVPQSVDPNDTRPHTVPTIDLVSLPSYFLTPAIPLYLATETDKAQQCHCHVQLTIPTIKDDDPTVDLEARWFLDYDLNVPQSQGVALTQDLAGSLNSNSIIREEKLIFDLDADVLGLLQGPHIIEVVLAERQGFVPDTSNIPPPHRALRTDSGGWDGTTYKVVVNVQPSQPGVTQCDRNTPIMSPPLARICAQ